MKLAQAIGKIGENPTFITFQAHCWFAATVILAAGSIRAAVAVVCAAIIKEFWFDLRFEQDPPQTIADGALDFAGYVAGAAVGVACLLVK